MDFPLFQRTLKHVKDHGCLPKDMYSKEDQNLLGESHVDDKIVQQAAADVEKWFAGLELPDSMKHIQICLIDGFLLFSNPAKPSVPKAITDMLDLKLFLRATLAQMIERRGKRAGYVTLGDFWVDPPGYVEDVVWSNYAQEHAWMFEGGDADSGKLVVLVKQEGVLVAPGNGDAKMVDLMAWGIERVKQVIERTV
jgi:nicotinamide/nicotinate riboside kinase